MKSINAFKNSLNLAGIMTAKNDNGKSIISYSTERKNEITNLKNFINDNNFNISKETFDGEDYFIRFSK